MSVLVAFEGDKVAFEHLFWDHAAVLFQAGVVTHPAAGVGVRAAADLRKMVEAGKA